jgi:hypothetical protein
MAQFWRSFCLNRAQNQVISAAVMRASTSDYSRRDKTKDCMVLLYDGFLSYLLIFDKASCYVWVFLTHSKSPPLDIISKFLQQHGHKEGGCIRTDQGGELARSADFQDMLLCTFHYTFESTGADSPSQNDAAKMYNDKFAVHTCTLLYGSGLPTTFLVVSSPPFSISPQPYCAPGYWHHPIRMLLWE